MAQPLGLSFDPDRPPVAPVDAATVIVMRDAAGLEVFCVQRHAKSPFLGGAIVFPGGKLDPSDASPLSSERVQGAHPRAKELGKESPGALLVAAARELVEEACILPSPIGHTSAAAIRRAMKEGASFEAALGAASVTVAGDSLVPFARWVTPEAEPRRFDARFFLLELPHGQQGVPDEHETTLGFWATPDEALRRFHRGDIQLAPPTTRTLEILAPARTVREALRIAEEQDLSPVCPRFFPADPPFLALPGDPAHELSRVVVQGPSRFVLRDGRLVSEDPPR